MTELEAFIQAARVPPQQISFGSGCRCGIYSDRRAAPLSYHTTQNLSEICVKGL